MSAFINFITVYALFQFVLKLGIKIGLPDDSVRRYYTDTLVEWGAVCMGGMVVHMVVFDHFPHPAIFIIGIVTIYEGIVRNRSGVQV